MSLKPCNRKHARRLVELKAKCTLKISAEIMKKINYLHTMVDRGTEWSSILIYSTESGSINDLDLEDPEKWVLQVDDVIPMDVGTAGYTEYEIDAEDTYAFDIWTEALLAEKKMGHLHTHHSMSCFFSGTDTSELHDNAPNHAYYLSLIVNYADPTGWCAKVAVCGEETIEVTKKVGKKVTSWTASEKTIEEGGAEAEETEEVVVPLLYTVDCIIETEDYVPELPADFCDRVYELNEDKGLSTGLGKVGAGNWPMVTGESRLGQNAHVGRNGERSENTSGIVLPMGNSIEDDDEDLWAEYLGAQYGMSPEAIQEIVGDSETTSGVNPINKGDMTGRFRMEHCFSPAKVKPFFTKILAVDLKEEGSPENIFVDIEKLSPMAFEEHVDHISTAFERFAEIYFDIIADDMDYHCLAISCMDLMEPYKNTRLFDPLTEVLEQYILSDIAAPTQIVTQLTGLQFTN